MSVKRESTPVLDGEPPYTPSATHLPPTVDIGMPTPMPKAVRYVEESSDDDWPSLPPCAACDMDKGAFCTCDVLPGPPIEAFGSAPMLSSYIEYLEAVRLRVGDCRIGITDRDGHRLHPMPEFHLCMRNGSAKSWMLEPYSRRAFEGDDDYNRTEIDFGRLISFKMPFSYN